MIPGTWYPGTWRREERGVPFFCKLQNFAKNKFKRIDAKKKYHSTLNLVLLVYCLRILEYCKNTYLLVSSVPSTVVCIRIGITGFNGSTVQLTLHVLVRILFLITSDPFLFFAGSVLQIDCKLFPRGIF